MESDSKIIDMKPIIREKFILPDIVCKLIDRNDPPEEVMIKKVEELIYIPSL